MVNLVANRRRRSKNVRFMYAALYGLTFCRVMAARSGRAERLNAATASLCALFACGAQPHPGLPLRHRALMGVAYCRRQEHQ
jgi:hypothetical protein